MNGNSSGENDRADRRIADWAELSATSRPAAAHVDVFMAGAHAGATSRPRAGRAVPGLAMAVLAVVLVAGIGFGLAQQRSVVTPPAPGSEVATLSASPAPTLSPAPVISVGREVARMAMIDANSGWVYRYGDGDPATLPLLMTNDAGRTWRSATPPMLTSIPQIEFVDADHGWALDDGKLWRTTDGGRSWLLNSLLPEEPGVMAWASPTTGYLLYGLDTLSPVLWRTDDGGATVRRVGPVILSPEAVLETGDPHIAFTDPLHGVIAGWSMVLQTSDGGLHWTQTLGHQNVDQLRAFNPYVVVNAWAPGYSEPSIVTYVSDDAGQSWQPASNSLGEPATYVWAIVDGRTWLRFISPAGGPIHVKVTTDGGHSETDTTSAGLPGWHMMTASFVSPTDGWAIFENDSTCQPNQLCPFQPGRGELATTQDGGVTWHAVP